MTTIAMMNSVIRAKYEALQKKFDELKTDGPWNQETERQINVLVLMMFWCETHKTSTIEEFRRAMKEANERDDAVPAGPPEAGESEVLARLRRKMEEVLLW